MNERVKASISLILLSPMIAELLSSSSPPIEFFNPVAFIYLTTFYGFGSILVREFRIRLDLPYVSLIFLGFIYGVIEEGIAVKSFFNPEWPDLGILAWYGRFYGVNWIWMQALIIYHGFISIFIPIALVDIIYYSLRNERYIHSRKTLLIIMLIYLIDVLLFNLGYMGSYPLYPYQYIICIILMVIFYLAGRRIRLKPIYNPGRPLTAWIIGFIWMTFFYIIYFSLPHLNITPLLTSILGLIHAYLGLRYYTTAGEEGISRRIRLAGLIGPPSLFIVLSPFMEMDKTRPDNPAGMTIVGIIFAIYFILLYRRISDTQRIEN
ncbi:hypothetical protein DRN84_01025 [Candidatus Geothermarchaeota archaeon]|nr:MAG: hypothetical protein DRN87_05620 [Candidatus Geothermarchaeota archaeon]RLG62767.1 MAG: hypothetical protein DRN84_01025 [Candidatus Geothermarchaeota archaeon]HEW93820.1 hypothetical protein [Thermoprotei archaeon]